MSIFKGLASKRQDGSKQEDPPKADNPADAEPSSGKLHDIRERQKAASSDNLFAEDDFIASIHRDLPGGTMWDLVGDADEPDSGAPNIREEPDDGAAASATAPEDGRARRSGRIKTRLLGIDHSNGALEEIGARATSNLANLKFPVGWLVIIEGPGRGKSFPLGPGASQIGRGEDQAVPLDFGDTAISREGHAIIAYDDETRGFFLGHGGKSNLVRLNGRPVLSTEAISSGDVIRIGETSLKLAALCSAEFSWSDYE